MKRRFGPTQEEIELFRAAVKDVMPLNQPARITFDPPKPSPRPRQRELDEASVIIESLYSPLEADDLFAIAEMDSFIRNGVSRRILKDLRRGRWSIQNHTDLHGLNRNEAHEEVLRFLVESLTQRKRCVRIVHGRGYGSPGREGILKPLVKSWLVRRQEVLAFCHAPPSDGGEGALWILLKPPRF